MMPGSYQSSAKKKKQKERTKKKVGRPSSAKKNTPHQLYSS
jgi:hypothetical protein